jgi:hypothetical protein
MTKERFGNWIFFGLEMRTGDACSVESLRENYP